MKNINKPAANKKIQQTVNKCGVIFVKVVFSAVDLSRCTNKKNEI
jgi:hypothetical protein